VARRVEDVDLKFAIAHGRILGHDRDSALAFEIHRVHHAVHHGLIFAMRARLLKHRVHERRLAVVDVGDDGDVAYSVWGDHSRRSWLKGKRL
jgi:hypothetical protein